VHHFVRSKKFVYILLLVVGSVALYVYVEYANRYVIPRLVYLDVDAKKQAGFCDRVTGRAFIRAAVPEDYISKTGVVAAAPAEAPGWLALSTGSEVLIGAVVRLEKDAMVQMTLAGGWTVGLNGPGEYLFEDARRDEKRTKHSMLWTVRHGRFRAKLNERARARYWLRTRTAVADVFVHQGEVGMSIPPDGRGGQIWRVSGRVYIGWFDGRTRHLSKGGLNYL